jgi:hypothetical protein
MPFQKILKSEGACCKRIEDLKAKDGQEDCKYSVFNDKPFFIYEEEQRQDQCQKNADDGQETKKGKGHKQGGII